MLTVQKASEIGYADPYIDDMTDLMLNHGLQQSKEVDGVRVIAGAKTFMVLRELNGDRKGALLRFLWEAQLIGGTLNPGPPEAGNLYPPIILLHDADLSEANLSEAILYGAYLRQVNLR